MSEIDLAKYYSGRYADCEHNMKKLIDDMVNMIVSLSNENERLRRTIEDIKDD